MGWSTPRSAHLSAWAPDLELSSCARTISAVAPAFTTRAFTKGSFTKGSFTKNGLPF